MNGPVAQIAPWFHQGMHHVEQLGRFLHFVDDHRVGRCPSGGDPLGQSLWFGLIGAQHFRCQQIHPQGIVKLLLQPGGFAGAARAEQEEAAGRRLQKSSD